MKYIQLKLLLWVIFLFAAVSACAQEKFTISGFVKEVSSGESLLGANVYVKEGLQGTSTNAYGFYSMTLPKGNYTLVISFVGYVERQFSIALDKDIHQNISLEN